MPHPYPGAVPGHAPQPIALGYQPPAAMAAHPVAKPADVPAPAAADAAADPRVGLPEGWSATRDASGKVYYWHRQTKKVQWDRPTAETPIQ